MAKNGATKEDIDIVRAQVGQAKAALASVEKQYRNAVITSPIDGVVAHRRVEPGEVVLPPMMPGGGLIQILDTSTLKTRVNISENQIKAVRLGQKAEIALDGFPGENFSGNVSRISPVVDSQSRTFEAEILMPNPDGRLKPGMFARVQLVLAERKGVVIVPLKAVSDEEQGPQIFVAGEGTAHARPVTLGISDGIDVEVVSGVEVGEMIIVKGNLGLEAGTKIVVEKE
jgi:membrane fusion protein (multidrug efflux system)